MLRNRGVITKTLRNALQAYYTTLKVCFPFAIFSSAIAEYSKIYALNSGIDIMINEYHYMGSLDSFQENLKDIETLAFLGIFSTLMTVFTYGFLICIGDMYFNKKGFLEKDTIKRAFSNFRNRLLLFLIACILSSFLWFLLSFLSIFGLWFAASFTVILLPNILLERFSLWISLSKVFCLLRKNVIYSLELGFILMVILLVKNISYLLFMSRSNSNNISFGIEHVLIIFFDALTLPFVVMIMVSSFYQLKTRAAK